MGRGTVGGYTHQLVVLVLLGGMAARAEAPGPAPVPRGMPTWVRLLLPECPTPPVDARILLEILGTELRDDGIQRADSGSMESGQAEEPQAYLRLTLPCEADVREVTLRVEDPVSLKAVERRMEFDDLPASAKPRALALGLAELLRASWPWLVMLEPPLVSVPEGSLPAALAEPPGPVESALMQEPVETSPVAPEQALTPPVLDPGKLVAGLSPPSGHEAPPLEQVYPSPSMQLSGKTLWFLDQRSRVWGGQVLGEYGRWSLGAQLLASSVANTRGEIGLKLVTGTLGFTLLDLSFGSIELQSGASLAAGRASISGTPLGAGVKGAQGVAPYGAAMLSAKVRWWFSNAWACTVEAEAGHAVGLMATVDGQATASLAGWLGGLSLGVSFAP
jgi:hypothetical protein